MVVVLVVRTRCMTKMFIHDRQRVHLNWGDRLCGSQTPGDATLGLDVQLDGDRKMPVKRSKTPLQTRSATWTAGTCRCMLTAT